MTGTLRFDLRPGVTDPVVLQISRREVEAGDVQSVVGRLNETFASADAIWRYCGQMSLVIDGYLDDVRELVDITEVRQFVRQLDQSWPYWAFFFNQVDDSLKLYLSCLCGGFFPGGGAVEIDGKKLGLALQRGFAAMNAIFDDNGFLDDKLEVLSNGVIEYVELAGMVPG